MIKQGNAAKQHQYILLLSTKIDSNLKEEEILEEYKNIVDDTFGKFLPKISSYNQ